MSKNEEFDKLMRATNKIGNNGNDFLDSEEIEINKEYFTKKISSMRRDYIDMKNDVFSDLRVFEIKMFFDDIELGECELASLKGLFKGFTSFYNSLYKRDRDYIKEMCLAIAERVETYSEFDYRKHYPVVDKLIKHIVAQYETYYHYNYKLAASRENKPYLKLIEDIKDEMAWGRKKYAPILNKNN